MAIPTVAIVENGMSLHAGQAKKLLRGQIIIAKTTLERAPDDDDDDDDLINSRENSVA